MRRSFVPSLLLLAALAAAMPSSAETTGAVAAVANQYVPGDDDYGKDFGAPGLPGLAVRHVKGRQLQFVNTDIVPHSLTAWCTTANACGASVTGTRRFETAILAPGGTADVARVSGLAVGSYRFFCKQHSTLMFGTLTIIAGP